MIPYRNTRNIPRLTFCYRKDTKCLQLLNERIENLLRFGYRPCGYEGQVVNRVGIVAGVTPLPQLVEPTRDIILATGSIVVPHLLMVVRRITGRESVLITSVVADMAESRVVGPADGRTQRGLLVGRSATLVSEVASARYPFQSKGMTRYWGGAKSVVMSSQPDVFENSPSNAAATVSSPSTICSSYCC